MVSNTRVAGSSNADSWDGDSSDDSAALSGWGTADLDSVFLDRTRSQWLQCASKGASTDSMGRRPAGSGVAQRPLPPKKKKMKQQKEEKEHRTESTQPPAGCCLQLAKAQSTSPRLVASVPRATVRDHFALPSPPAATLATTTSGGTSCRAFAARGIASISSKVTVAQRSRAANDIAVPCKIVGLIGDADEWRPLVPRRNTMLHSALETHSRPQRLVFPSDSLESLLSALTLTSSNAEQQLQLRQRFDDTKPAHPLPVLLAGSSATASRPRRMRRLREGLPCNAEND